MTENKRISIFIAAVAFLLALIGHSPWTGYKTYGGYSEPSDCGIVGMTGCSKTKLFPLDFSEWSTYEPLIKWLGNVPNFIAISLFIVISLGLWLYLSRSTKR